MRRLIAIVLALGLLGALAAPAAAQTNGGLLQGLPVTGVLEGTGETFEGTLDITSITRDGTVLMVTGAIEGLLDGEPISDTFTATLDLARGGGNQGNGQGQGQGSCQILFLELGPLFLDVLGLVIEIPDPIVLDVRAEPGPGNLLGNLLCAVAGLLDGGPFAAIDRLLDRINQLL
jgi:hypothetical protein